MDIHSKKKTNDYMENLIYALNKNKAIREEALLYQNVNLLLTPYII